MNLLDNQEAEKPDSKQPPRIEFRFPLLTVRTKAFSRFFDKLGSYRASKYLSWVALFLVPFVAAIGLFLIFGSLFALLTNPAVGTVSRQLGPGSILLLPGINPLLPIAYGWIAIVVAIAIHEGAHGVVARNAGFRVKSSGLLFFLIVPIGAFVDVDEEQIKNAKPRPSLRVMAAGVGANTVLSVVCLVGVLAIAGTLVPVVDGVYVSEVTKDAPAQAAGLLAKDVLFSIDGTAINSTEDVRNILGERASGEVVSVTVVRGSRWQTQFTTSVILTKLDNRTVMGVMIGDLATRARLDNYLNFSFERLPLYLVPPTLVPGLVPFSDTFSAFYESPLGSYWAVFANLLFWVWFVSFNLAIFNALPIYPLDGGRIFKIGLIGAFRGRMSERGINSITIAVTAVCVVAVVGVAVLPFIM